MNRDDLVRATGRLQAAFERLADAVERAADDLDEDGAIQRFEFTFELLWKTAKIFLQYEGIRCRSPRSCIKEGAKMGLLVDGELLLDMLADRNRIAHIYNERMARGLFLRIKNRYVETIAANVRQLTEYLE